MSFFGKKKIPEKIGGSFFKKRNKIQTVEDKFSEMGKIDMEIRKMEAKKALKKRKKNTATPAQALLREDFLGGKAKKIRKHSGINKSTGRLKKGYKYSGKKLKSGLPQIVKSKLTCKGHLSVKIRKNMHEKRYKNKKQAIAVAFAQVKKARPGCKRVLSKRKKKKIGGDYRQSFKFCKSC